MSDAPNTIPEAVYVSGVRWTDPRPPAGPDEDHEIYVPSVDVCAWCADSECDGIGCIASLDPNDPDDLTEVEHLHEVIRAGKVWLQADKILAEAENRR